LHSPPAVINQKLETLLLFPGQDNPDLLIKVTQSLRRRGLLTPENRAAARAAIEEKYLAAPNVIGVIVGR
jgi:hypothetical protein